MDNKVCFMFGHATTPYSALPLIETAAERHYLEYGIRTFIVGNRGNFDNYAATAISRLKERYKDISLLLLLAYHPAERPVFLTDGFDNSYYPPLENVPRPFTIVRANQYMVNKADSIICYVKHPGNTRNLIEYVSTSYLVALSVAANLLCSLLQLRRYFFDSLIGAVCSNSSSISSVSS